jgi:hypothetical protein
MLNEKNISADSCESLGMRPGNACKIYRPETTAQVAPGWP